MGNEEHPFSMGSPRDALVNLVERAPRAEAGVREQQTNGKPTGYYAGRKAGFVASAATLASMLFGTDYEAAKATISKSVADAGKGLLSSDLRRPSFAGQLATEITNSALNL